MKIEDVDDVRKICLYIADMIGNMDVKDNLTIPQLKKVSVCGRQIQMWAKEQTKLICEECSGFGTSYIDHTRSINDPYHNDHMNAHICGSCHGSGKKKGK